MKVSPTEVDQGSTKIEERLVIHTTPALIRTALPDGNIDFFNRLHVAPKQLSAWSRLLNLELVTNSTAPVAFCSSASLHQGVADDPTVKGKGNSIRVRSCLFAVRRILAGKQDSRL